MRLPDPAGSGGRRVAVSGLGAVAAAATGAEALWTAVRGGATGITAPGTAAGSSGSGWPHARVAGFDPAAYFAPRQIPMLDRVTQFALVAARQAMDAAGCADPARAGIDPERAGVVYAAGLGHHTLDDAYLALYGSRQASRLHPFLVPRGMPSAPCSQLSMAFGLQGPSFATATACASSAHAIGIAFQLVRAGMLDLALTGGAEASLVPGMVKAWEGLRVMSADTCRPFSRDRSGLVLGEGAAALVLESWDQALGRGVRPLAEVVGFGMGADAVDITVPDPAGAARAMRAALKDAALDASAVDYVNAHGTGTRLNDRCEAEALRDVFGARLAAGGLPASSSKGQLGHCLNAGGALEALLTVLALRDGVLPPTMNFRAADPECALDCVPNAARALPIDVAMSNSFAFGGLNAVLLLRRV